MHLECKRCVELFDVSDVMSLTTYGHVRDIFSDEYSMLRLSELVGRSRGDKAQIPDISEDITISCRKDDVLNREVRSGTRTPHDVTASHPGKS